jgi:hypothetical protein
LPNTTKFEAMDQDSDSAYRAVSVAMENIAQRVSAIPVPPDNFYCNIEALLIEIRDILKKQCVTYGQQVAAGPALREGAFAASSKKLHGKGWQQAHNVNARRAGTETATREAAAGERNSRNANAAHSSKTPAPHVIAPQENSPLAQEMDSSDERMNSARKTKTRDNMFKYTSADIAEAAEEIIIVMTDAQLGLTMPGTKSLAKKFGAPEKSTGLQPDIGSIVVQTTTQGKQIWHLISKFHANDKLQMKTHRFYKNHNVALQSLRAKLLENKVENVAISRLGACYLGVHWRHTLERMNRLFAADSIKFNVHSLPKKVFVSGLDTSATDRETGGQNTTKVAQGDAGGCLLQLPNGPDQRPPPQHAPAPQVRANGGKKPNKDLPNSLSTNVATPRDATIDEATPNEAPTQNKILLKLRQEVRQHLETSAADDDKDGPNARNVAQGVAGGCLLQLPNKGLDERPTPQHAPALQVRADGGNQAENGLHNSFSTLSAATIESATPKDAPTQEEFLSLRQEVESMRKSLATSFVDISGEIKSAIRDDGKPAPKKQKLQANNLEEFRDELENMRKSLATISKDTVSEMRILIRDEIRTSVRSIITVDELTSKHETTPLKENNTVSKLSPDRVETLQSLLASPPENSLSPKSSLPTEVPLPPSPSKNPLPALIDTNITTRKKAKSPKNSLKSLLGMGT